MHPERSSFSHRFDRRGFRFKCNQVALRELGERQVWEVCVKVGKRSEAFVKLVA